MEILEIYNPRSRAGVIAAIQVSLGQREGRGQAVRGPVPVCPSGMVVEVCGPGPALVLVHIATV